jgi:hypothetical protein
MGSVVLKIEYLLCDMNNYVKLTAVVTAIYLNIGDIL